MYICVCVCVCVCVCMLPWWLSGKEPACQCRRWGLRVQSRGWKDPVEEEVATHSGILTWRIPWTEQTDVLQSMGSERIRHDFVTKQHQLLYIYVCIYI